MKESTRKRKEGLMVKAASRILDRKGLTNFTMEEVAEEGNVTKVTLYTYFTSKENLTMAVCYGIHHDLYKVISPLPEELKDLSGLDTCIEIKSRILKFISEDPFRATMILEFISVYNMPHEKLSEAMATSPYRELLNQESVKIIDILNNALEKGRQDTSIKNQAPNQALTIYLWNCMSGFITLASTPGFQDGKGKDSLQELSDHHEQFARQILANDY